MKINKVIKTLIYSDIVLNSAFGFVSPIFAVFITDQISGGNVKVVGFAAAIYWMVKSPLQIPIAKWLDKNHGERDDFWFMIIGTLIFGVVPFGYIWSTLPWHIYILQILQAVGMAMVVPSWSAIFTRHIDKGKEAFEWSVRSTSLGIGIGITGALGGIFVSRFGFQSLFALVGILAVIATLLLLIIKKDLYRRPKGPLPKPQISPIPEPPL